MLLDVALHDLAIESKRSFVSELVRKLALFWLDNVGLAHADDVRQAILLPVGLVLGLLVQEALMAESCVNLLSETARWALVLGRFLVEFCHFRVKLVNLAFVYHSCSLAQCATLLRVWGARRASAVLLFEFFDLLLDISYSFLKDLVFEEFVAEGNSEVRAEAHFNGRRIGPLHRRLAC